ncbi:MAG: hypothetical protein ACI8YQ_002787 [Polaribacter sp.]|jgi:hypothetical protein
MRYLMKPLFVLCSLFFFNLSLSARPIVKSSISFYMEKLEINYSPEMIIVDKKRKVVCTKNKCLEKFYAKMKEGPYQVLLRDLMKHRDDLQLNDWLYAKLVRKAVDKVYINDKELHKALVWWFLLNESGYDCRITVSELVHVFLYAPTKEKMIDMASFSEDGKKFYNLTAKIYNVDTRIAVFNKPKFIANPEGKNFSFSLEKMPNLTPNPVAKKITFQYKGEPKEITVNVDKVVQEILIDYPKFDEMGMMNASLSATLDESLRTELGKLMEGKSQREQLEVLASFTRSAFKYKWDWDVYDKEQPMFAEQVFHSKYSDHEDRCALYFYLVKTMLGLPMIVITHYNNNMTLGVVMDEKMKRSFNYKGKNFTICDPTHPTSTGEIGRYPNGMTKNTASVLGEYGM